MHRLEPSASAHSSVPPFPPIRTGSRGHRIRRRLRGKRVAGAALVICGLLLATSSLVTSQPVTPTAAAHASSPDTAEVNESPGADLPTATEQPGDPTSRDEPPPEDEADVLVRAPIRLADAALTGVLAPGDRVDVLAVPIAPDAAAGPRQARRIAHRARVAEIPVDEETGRVDRLEGALIVVEVSPRTAGALAGSMSDSRLTVTRW